MNEQSLYRANEAYFMMGLALSKFDMDDSTVEAVVRQNFNCVTCENETKPMFLMDYEKTLALNKGEGDGLNIGINTETIDHAADYAKKNNMKLRLHTLVWHGQTPLWFFKQGFVQDKNLPWMKPDPEAAKEPPAPWATRPVMLQRMESYIKAVLEYCKEKYPGLFYAVDVVNEAIEPANLSADNQAAIRSGQADAHGNYLGFVNPWYMSLGPDYVEKAFFYARKYAPPEMKLYYNDYNASEPNKVPHILSLLKRLKDGGLVDGMGLQAHIHMKTPPISQMEEAILKYAALGLEIQLTELDINNTDNSDEALAEQAARYKELLTMLRALKTGKKADITALVFWGLQDNHSWLNKPDKRNYPLLFNDERKEKPAYYSFIEK
jgi:endo-1,4-beta-xylanase